MALMQSFGFTGRALRCELEELRYVSVPAILHWRFNHYVVLEKVTRKGLRIHDPASGSRWMSLEEASPQFTGVLLEISPPPVRFEGNVEARGRIASVLGRVVGLKSAIGQVLLLTLVVQIFVLAAPFMFQLVIDSVLDAGNTTLLLPITLTFGALASFYILAMFMRALALARAGSSFGFQASVGIAQRLFRLPVPYFLQRDVGDLLSRISSLVPIRDLLVGQTAQALLDGVLALVVLMFLFLYSIPLALLSLAALALYAAASLLSAPLLKRERERMVIEKAREQQVAIESIRGIATLKMFGKEAERLNVWQNHLSRAVTAELKHAQLRALVEASLIGIVALENVVSLAIAASLAMGGGMSIGAIVAYFAYKTYLFTKSGEALRYLTELRISRLHLDRLSDITEEADDVMLDFGGAFTELKGRLQLEDVWFRYSDNDPWVLKGASFDVEAGEHVSIEGVSGSGKSTLMLLLLGLYRPTRGRILVDGRDLKDFGVRSYRRQVIGVLQTDQLFSGSVRENISFFDPEIDFIKVQECALAASIHDEILEMPMRYDTIIGEAGATLSGGQRQRIVLARALYQEPKVLIVDEATAHLDCATEDRVNACMEALKVTRIVFAHRRETLERAERGYVLQEGKLTALAMRGHQGRVAIA